MSEAPSLQFTVKRNRGDYLSGLTLHALRSQWSLVWFAPVFINGAIVWYFSRLDDQQERVVVLAGFVVLTAALMALAFASCLLLGAFNSWRTPGALEAIDYRIAESGVFASAVLGAGESKWQAFDGAWQNRRVVVLRQRPGLLHIIPRRDLSNEAQTVLRATIREHLRGSAHLKEQNL
jgi:hypothetical protein